MLTKNLFHGLAFFLCALFLSISCGLLTNDNLTPSALDTPIPATPVVDTLASVTPAIQEKVDCEQPLDDEIIDQLTLSLGTLLEGNELQPGDTYQFEIGYTECCYIFQEVDACTMWSVEPETLAIIDHVTGFLTVEEDTPHGSVITVKADVENGRHIITQDVVIFTPAGNPLVGIWQEKVQLSCESGEEVVPLELIGELKFEADGRFAVTWAPFEVYQDYWGDYTFDLETQTIELTIDGGNHIPDNVDGSGTFRFGPNGELILEDMWLGEPVFEALSVNCGHIFE